VNDFRPHLGISRQAHLEQAHLDKLDEPDEPDERDELEMLGDEDNKKRPGFPGRSFYRKFMITSPHV
jgi:hypothetical protein